MARPDISMTPDAVAAVLASQRSRPVATLGHDGFPHLAPMWFVVEDGRIVFRSFTKSQKIVNLRRDPRLSVLVEDGEDYAELRGVMVKGTARLVEDRDEVLRLYGKVSVRYTMPDVDADDLDPAALEAMFGRFADKNTVVVVEPTQVISWDHRKLGGSY
ncbi:MAG: TIGR03618 family F420-dependent PPOX class oxidoreductase [Acidimicrobiia bacterium]